jgi:aspartate aminotransferase-like enzyme
VDGRRFLARLEERFGVKLAGGQGPLKGKVFRLAHLGLLDELDVLGAIAAIELGLVEFGQEIKLGTGVAAASAVLAAAVEAARLHEQADAALLEADEVKLHADN